MDTKKLRHFLAVYETGSFGQAAAITHVTQPAITKSVKQLEERLRVKLFDRTPMGVVATAFGESLASHAKAIEAELRAAETDLSMIRGATEGHVIIGISPSIAENLMPLATARLYRMKPGVKLTVIVGLVDDLIPGLRRGELDFALSVWSDPSDPELSSEVILRDEVTILVSADHPLANKAEVSPKDLLDFPWALPAQRVAWRSRLDRLFVEHGLSPPVASVSSNSASFLRALVLQGHFIGVLPHRLVMLEQREGRLVRLPVPGPTLDVEINITYRSRASRSPAARALLSILREVVDLAEAGSR